MVSRPHLPGEIIEEILIKLPVKSIIRFKSVSKSWFDLITSDRFIFKHLFNNEKSFLAMCFKIREEKSQPDLWVLDLYPYDDHKEKSESESDSDSQIEAADYTWSGLRFELPSPDHLVGNCYGILCLIKSRDNIWLVNPSLGELKNIQIPPSSSSSVGESCTLVGIGFDNTAMDFKVVRIMGSRRRRHRAEVYSIGSSNSWRELEINRIPLVDDSTCSIFFNGIVHWCVTTKHLCWRIITFNPTTELFQKMENPQGWCNNSRRIFPRLFVLNQESLAFVAYRYASNENQFVNVWIRNKHGIQETWTKLYSIGPLYQLRKPVSFLKKDEFLYQTNDRQLILYDIINQRSSPVFDRSQIRLALSSVQMEVCGSCLLSINR